MNIINISIIFPFYNEEKRILNLFKEIKKIKNYKINYDIIFVNDGSTDNSLSLVKNFILKEKKCKLITYKNNRGKGYAIKKGVLNSKFEWILTCDIDLSVKLDFFLIWFNKYNFNKKCAYFGSRNLKLSKTKTLFIRKFMGLILNLFIKYFLDNSLKDTQCGYKIYNKLYAKKIFKRLFVYDFTHDLEVILLLKKEKIKIIELPVKWKHVSGSKVNLVKDSILFFNYISKIVFYKLIRF